MIAKAVELSKKQLEYDRKQLRDALESDPNPPGLVEPDDDTFMRWVSAMMQKYPPIDIMSPSGTPIKESPWLLMLSLDNVGGGKQILDRINRVKRKAVL